MLVHTLKRSGQVKFSDSKILTSSTVDVNALKTAPGSLHAWEGRGREGEGGEGRGGGGGGGEGRGRREQATQLMIV